MAAGRGPIAGIDEAGRGPLAGPVVAAAVILDPACIPEGLDDSKRLTPEARERLFTDLSRSAEIGVGIADVHRIDRDNILRATLWAMAEAARRLGRRPATALVDGNRAPELDCTIETIVSGDAKVASIAAASIVAKVTRDRAMRELADRYPAFGFERHKGYGTAEHLAALRRLGPTPEHRRSFAPVAAALGESTNAEDNQT
ncbi:MAG: ribonuclease HII [Hyphomicrobiaceae bacterium]